MARRPNMDTKQSPQTSLRSGGAHPESDGDQYFSSDEDENGGENGERPRKRQRRPMSVS